MNKLKVTLFIVPALFNIFSSVVAEEAERTAPYTAERGGAGQARGNYNHGEINRGNYYHRDGYYNGANYGGGYVAPAYPAYYPGYIPPDQDFMPGEREANDIYKANQHPE